MHNATDATNPGTIRIGIDIGGTFTDFVYYDPSTALQQRFKLLSTPHDPAEAVLPGIERILLQVSSAGPCTVVHGSTVATNALLERKGARTALVTTRGFRDVLEIGRQNRPSLYDLNADRPQVIVPEELRYEVNERVDSHGRIIVPLDLEGLEKLVLALQASRVESVAVTLLFSFLNPEHETICTQKLRQAGYFVSVSSEVLPEFREYERTSTTVVNAYVTPVLEHYLSRLHMALGSLSGAAALRRKVYLHVMQSNGGMISPQEASRNGVRCILSGPAGGIVAARQIGATAWAGDQLADLPDGFRRRWASGDSGLRLITFDMGGTSTDVSLIDGEPQVTTETLLDGCPIGIPVLDIHSIGAGGGSIACVDLGGALRVGPESAGAFPGPACYGFGGPESALPTVTDANLLLGRLPPDYFLDGRMTLDSTRSLQAIAPLAEQLGITPLDAALGIIEVANAHMERALRLISVERGHDPRQFTLLSFGGAGGLHATDLAARLGIPRLLVPRQASTFSAYGMLAANVVKDYSRTVMLPGDTPIEALQALYKPLLERGIGDLLSEGVREEDTILERQVDLRYRGQSYELSIPFGEDFISRFHSAHRQRYGYDRLEARVEIVNLRVKCTGLVSPPPPQVSLTRSKLDESAYIGHRQVYFASGWQSVGFYDLERLTPGMEIPGPAVIVCQDTMVLVGNGWFLVVGMNGDLLVVNDYTHYI